MIKQLLTTCILCSVLLNSTSLFAQKTQMLQALSENLTVSGQLDNKTFQLLLKQGFKSVIVNRPDQEMGNNVSVSQLRNIAEQSHVSVIYQPIENGKITQTDIIEFSKYYNELPKPILMICKSGQRSSELFNEARKQGLLHE
ncbi:beta-lactamase hydrolase domain-containing protein [Acinetobacter tandoii]|uniref:TIGR01244 family protein n=1 Tax=Acinetobacter tandoii DSM 14970 = CIP 107469 TaxID=1120927 RepID=R9B4T4_9GAMM|nr:TIGR01244 family protein [Acinetobacter tandoii DSM 14970 = CIP 107469]